MARIFVTRELPGAGLARLGEVHRVEIWPAPLPPPRADLLRGVAGAEGLLCLLSDRIDAELFAAASNLRAVANFAVGYDNIDLAEAERRGIAVGNTPGVLTETTADLTFGLILAAARGLIGAAADAREGRWRTWEPAGWLGHDVHGATLLVIGPGAIGSAVARRADGFAMRVLFAGRGDDLAPRLAEADFVSLHLPLSDATQGLIGEPELEAMKPTAYLINTARGELVDQSALRRALDRGSIAGAGIDVSSPEPLDADNPLHGARNLTVLPHIGSASHATRSAMAELAVDNLLAALDRRPMPHPVTESRRPDSNRGPLHYE